MFLDMGDGQLFFDVEGAKIYPRGSSLEERPTLVLIHGGPGFDHSHYKPSFSALRDDVQLVYVDLRGHGRSDAGTPDQWTLNAWADDVHILCQKLAISHPIILGESFGSYVALAMAARHPQAVAKLILISTAARFVLDRKLAMFEKLGGAVARQAAQDFWQNPSEATMPGYMQHCMPLYTPKDKDPEGATRGIFRLEPFVHFVSISREMMTFDLRSQIQNITCPTLIVAGNLDPITPMDDAAEVLNHLPTGVGRLEVIPGAGHAPERSQPEKVFPLIRDFIRS